MSRSTTTAEQLRRALTGAYRRFNALQRGETRCFGVTMSQCVTLETLLEHGAIAVRDLAQRLGLETSTVTRLLDVLERDGMVERQRGQATDRRRVLASLTEKGESLARDLQGCGDAYCERILERIPKDRRADVIGGFEVLIEALEELDEQCGGDAVACVAGA